MSFDPGVMSKERDVKEMVAVVREWCIRNGVRFTPQRQMVLEIIVRSEKPVGAYDILAEMARTVPNPKPTTIYRAIEFLQSHAFIHRIESLNAYVPCHAGHSHDGSQFMVCDSCGTVQEVHLCSLPAPLQKRIDDTGFALSRWNMEIHGQCPACR